jgi:hypothetical protein
VVKKFKKHLTNGSRCGIIITVKKRKRYIKMRLIHYAVFNKTTKKRVYTNCDQRKCQEYLNKMPNKENYIIGYKWLSI